MFSFGSWIHDMFESTQIIVNFVGFRISLKYYFNKVYEIIRSSIVK